MSGGDDDVYYIIFKLMGQLAALNLFVIHAFKHGNQEERKFARFIIWNEVKGIVIANAFVFMLYASRFSNYRNSHLLLGNQPFQCLIVVI